MVTLTVLLFVLRAAAPAPSALGFSLKIEGETELRATISGPEADLAPGPFKGSIALNGSAAELPISGTVVHAAGQWRLPFVVRYADVPADWAERFRQDGFTYRLRSTGAAPREWTGTRAWKDVEVEGGKDSTSDYVVLDGVSLTHVSLLSSEASARVSVRNPFSFPLKAIPSSSRPPAPP